ADGAQAQPTPALATDKPWQMTLARAAVSGGRVQWRDDAPGHEPVAVDVNDLKLQAAGLTWPARPAETLALSGSLRLGAPGARPAGLGLLSWQGRLGLAPVAWVGKVQADRLPLQTMGAYLTPGLPVKLESLLASGTLDGTAALAEGGPSLALRGALQLADLHLAESAEEDVSGRDLLSWQHLTLDGLALQLAPQQRPKVAVASAALSEVFARLVVTERGRLNFNSLAAVPEPAASAAAVPAATPKPTLAPIIEVGGVQISRGRVDFADRFIRPNYRTDLTELNGRLGAFSSEAGAQQSATLELNGKAAGTATLAVRGSLKPTVQPLQLDIQARASDLELAPLSPYAGKYAGYAIERGKLTMDVAYRIEADGTLQARNQLLLNQLTFGERIESPDATRLPVQLAVALLKDRNGVIDLNLPISGSVNDPQFSVGALIFKVLGNVLSKAVTAPFALLSGGDETVQNVVAFLPGSADLSADARAQLSTLAGKLAERPALTMTVTGLADLASEQDALRASWLQGRLRAEARREALRAGAAEDTVQPELTPAKALEMLERVYSDAKLPNKPRNVLGLAKRLPAEDMASMLRASAPVTEESVRELALQRGIAVRDALLARGLPSERLFMAAPRWQAPAASDGTWAPRVELSLAMP
ncbi:DUF748 domain-containing protein, partial [Ideonella sp.]|uniref:DUF748 domain-containing protein n=1 Tax=Ideonella sp. TaxID=1929293 RepID=UPI003BB7CB2F